MKKIIQKSILPKWLVKLEAKVTKDFGVACKTYEPFCFVCRLWEAMVILEDLYSKGIEVEKKVKNEYVSLPVTVDFDKRKQIGTIQLKKDQLPDIGGYYFETGMRILEREKIKGEDIIKKVELLEVSLVPRNDKTN